MDLCLAVLWRSGLDLGRYYAQFFFVVFLRQDFRELVCNCRGYCEVFPTPSRTRSVMI